MKVLFTDGTIRDYGKTPPGFYFDFTSGRFVLKALKPRPRRR